MFSLTLLLTNTLAGLLAFSIADAIPQCISRPTSPSQVPTRDDCAALVRGVFVLSRAQYVVQRFFLLSIIDLTGKDIRHHFQSPTLTPLIRSETISH